MPTYKHRLSVEAARGIKAFLNLDVGATRGMVLDPDEIAVRFRQSQGQISALVEQISALTEQNHTLADQSRIMREQLENGGREISRLQKLTTKLQKLVRKQAAGEASGRRLDKVSGGGSPRRLPPRCIWIS